VGCICLGAWLFQVLLRRWIGGSYVRQIVIVVRFAFRNSWAVGTGESCGLLSDPDSPVNLIRTDAVFAVHDLPHSYQPLVQTYRNSSMMVPVFRVNCGALCFSGNASGCTSP
jgi:hypothetical protein